MAYIVIQGLNLQQCLACVNGILLDQAKPLRDHCPKEGVGLTMSRICPSEEYVRVADLKN